MLISKLYVSQGFEVIAAATTTLNNLGLVGGSSRPPEDWDISILLHCMFVYTRYR
jgi:hypothetical protein